MSNVLIGIIGVILFIGLALAGALFLGPRFQQSTNSSKGSAAVQAVSQVASSANMSNVQTGTAVTGAADVTAQLVTPGYLKSIPSNPVTTGNVPKLADASGNITTTPGAAKFAVMDLGTSADGVCQAIAQQSGQTLTGTAPNQTSPTGTVLPTTPSGCIKLSAAFGDVPADYIAFASI